MAERTGGPQRSTGIGSRPLAAAAARAEQAGREAYRLYVAHGASCTECPRCDFQCDEAAALWQAYIEARG